MGVFDPKWGFSTPNGGFWAPKVCWCLTAVCHPGMKSAPRWTRWKMRCSSGLRRDESVGGVKTKRQYIPSMKKTLYQEEYLKGDPEFYLFSQEIISSAKTLVCLRETTRQPENCNPIDPQGYKYQALDAENQVQLSGVKFPWELCVCMPIQRTAD